MIRARLDPNFSGEVNKEVDKDLREIEIATEKASRSISKSFTKATGDVNRSMDTLGAEARKAFKEVSDAGDLAADQITDDFDKLRAELQKGINLEIDSNVETATEQIRARIDELKAGIDRALVIDVNSDTATAQAEIKKLNAALRLIDRQVKVEVEVETDAAVAEAESLISKLLGIGDAGRGGGDSITSFGQLGFAAFKRIALGALAALTTIAPLTPILVGVAAAAVAVAGAIGLAAGSMITAGVAASSLLLAFAGLKVGMVGVGDAMKAQSKAQQELAATGEVSAATQKKLDEAMKRLSPSAREAVKALGSLSKEWGSLRRAVQENLFEDQAKNITRLSDVFRPLLQGVLVNVAGTLNAAADSFTNFITEGSRVEAIRTALTGLAGVLPAMLQGLGNLGAALGTLFGAAVGEAGDLANSFVSITGRFREFISAAAASGGIADFLDRASAAAGALFSVIGNLGRVLGGVFGAGASDGVGLLDSLANSLGNLNDRIRSVSGQDALARFFGTIATAGRALGDIFIALQPVVIGVGDVLTEMGKSLDLLRSVGGVAPLFQALGSALSALAPVLGPLLAGFIAFKGLMFVLGPVIAAVSGALSLIGSAAGIVSTAIAAFSAAGGGLAGVLAAIGGPITLVIAGIAALVVGLVLLYKNSQTVRDAVAQVGESIKKNLGPVFEQIANTVRDDIVPALRELWTSFKTDILPTLEVVAGVVLTLVVALAKLYLTVAGKVIPVLIKFYGTHLKLVIKSLSLAFDITGKVIGILVGLVTGVVNAGAAVVSAFTNIPQVLAAVLQFFTALPGQILGALGSLASTVATGFVSMMNAVLSAVGNGLLAVVGFFLTLPLQIAAALLSVTNVVLVGFVNLFTVVLPAIDAGIVSIVQFFIALPAQIVAALAALGVLVGQVFINGLNFWRSLVTNGIQAIVNFFTALPGRVLRGIQSIVSIVGGIFQRAFASARSYVSDGISKILSLITGLPGRISNTAGRFLDAGKKLGKSVIDGLSSGLKNTGGFLADIGNAIRNKVNSVLGLPRTLGKGPLKFTIPAFANGGIVTKATEALVGEAGKEVIIPLTRGSDRIRELVMESGLLNVLSQKDFTDLILPRLQQISGDSRRITSSSTAGSSIVNNSRSVNIERGAPAQNVRSTVVQANFELLATSDPEQQSEQIAARLSRLMGN